MVILKLISNNKEQKQGIKKMSTATKLISFDCISSTKFTPISTTQKFVNQDHIALVNEYKHYRAEALKYAKLQKQIGEKLRSIIQLGGPIFNEYDHPLASLIEKNTSKFEKAALEAAWPELVEEYTTYKIEYSLQVK